MSFLSSCYKSKEGSIIVKVFYYKSYDLHLGFFTGQDFLLKDCSYSKLPTLGNVYLINVVYLMQKDLIPVRLKAIIMLAKC